MTQHFPRSTVSAAPKARFTLAEVNGRYIVWDSEERMIVDEDEDRDELLDLAMAMNSLDLKFNHGGVQ